jgi:hypothetical protein
MNFRKDKSLADSTGGLLLAHCGRAKVLGTRPQLGQPGAENTLRIASLRRFSNQAAGEPASQRTPVARFLGHLFLPQPVITIERARKRDREMFAIFLSPDDNDGAREYFITALSHQPDFPAASQMPLDARATGKYCTLSW